MKVYYNSLALQWAVLVRNDTPTVVRVEIYAMNANVNATRVPWALSVHHDRHISFRFE